MSLAMSNLEQPQRERQAADWNAGDVRHGMWRRRRFTLFSPCLINILGNILHATVQARRKLGPDFEGGPVGQLSIFRALMNASCGMSTRPNWRIFFLPAFCLSRSLRLRVMSPP